MGLALTFTSTALAMDNTSKTFKARNPEKEDRKLHRVLGRKEEEDKAYIYIKKKITKSNRPREMLGGREVKTSMATEKETEMRSRQWKPKGILGLV